MMTQKNLHTHDHTSPVSGNSEVSCYGNAGKGDDGNHKA
jgi:dolichyl-phosphate-mannose--protein O-mannosyl transferase